MKICFWIIVLLIVFLISILLFVLSFVSVKFLHQKTKPYINKYKFSFKRIIINLKIFKDLRIKFRRFLQYIFNRMKKDVLKNGGKKTIKYLLVGIIALAGLSVIFVDTKYIQKSKSLLSVYTILIFLSIFTLFIILVGVIVDLIIAETSSLFRMLEFVYMICVILLISILGIKLSITKNVKFIYLIIFFFFEFGSVIYFNKKLFLASRKRLKHIFIEILVVLLMEMYLILLFGMYNISHIKVGLRDKNVCILFLQILQCGVYYSFVPQLPGPNTALFPLFEFLSTTFYNIVIFGLAITYLFEKKRG